MSKKILIVEDETVLFMVLEEQFKRKGYTVCENATTAQKAFDLFTQEKPDIILMDIRLARNTNGIEAARQIKERQKDAAIIFMSAYMDDDIYKEAMSIKPVTFLEKPVYIDVIEEIIVDYFNKL